MQTSESTQLRHTRRLFFVRVLTALVAASALTAAAATDAAPPPPGKLVDLGGCKLHLNCPGGSGDAGPTVVFESGAGGISADWYRVQGGVSAFARACSFARAVTAGGEVEAHPHTFRQTMYELHNLLADAGFKGPYILLGHSFDGIMLRNLPLPFPNDAAGKGLVEPAPGDGRLAHSDKLAGTREVSSGKPIPPASTTPSPAPKKLSRQPAPDPLAHAKSGPGSPCHLIMGPFPPIGS